MDKSLFFTKFLNSKTLLGFVIFIFVFKVLMSLIFVSFPENIFFADITKSSLVNMLNQTRYSLGIDSLTENELLDEAAQLKAQDMIQNGYFNHISPSGVTPWYWFAKAGYNYKNAGENLAIGFYDSKGVFQAWMNSSTHKENMLSSAYTEVGTAILTGYGENNAIVVVQLFGSPNKIQKAPVVKVEEKTEIKENKQEEVVMQTEKPEENYQRVLSSTDFIEIDKKTAVDNFYYRFLNFAIYSYDTLLQYVIYGLLGVIIMMMAYILSFNFNKQINNGLVLRSLILVGILCLSVLINKDLIISVLPGQMII
jgi:hypothetical protein